MNIELYQTPQAGELIDKLRVTGWSNPLLQPYQRAVMFSLPLTNIKAGDIIDLKAYGQVSNPNKFSVNPYGVVSSAIMFSHGTILAMSATAVVPLEELTEFRGTNITFEINHSPWEEHTHYVFKNDYNVVYVNQVVYAASMAISPTSTATYITVNKDYGRSSVMLFRMSV